MNSRLLALSGAIVLAGAAVGWALTQQLRSAPTGPSGPTGDAPNVLIVVWDTVRADRLSLYGHDRQTTPKLDAWAEDAVVFDAAISPAMWTVPSHSSMFTGMAPSHHGVKATYKWLDSHHQTLAEVVSAAGWDTFAFSANPYVAPSTNITQGFAEVGNSFSGAWRKASRENTQGKLIRRDASTDISPAWKGRRLIGDVHPFKDAGPVANEALTQWLDARTDKDRPWFAFINLMEAHIPRIPTMANRKALLDQDMIDKGLETNASQAELLAYTFGQRDYTPDELAAMQGVYDAALRDLDDVTAALFEALEQRGALDDTIVILTSDHGENLGDHHMFGHKFSVWDTLVHVPLVMRWDGHLQPRRVDVAVSNLSLFATVLDLLGLPLPDPAPDLSTSLLDLSRPMPVFSQLIESTPVAIRRVDKEHGLDDTSHWMRTFDAVRYEGWKLVVASDASLELYHVDEDPGETRDLHTERTDKVLALDALLQDWRASVPPYDPSLRTEEDRPPAMDAATRRMMKSLGYVEDDEEETDGQ